MSSFVSATEDPYRVLGVAETADISEIKKAYRKLALKHHPDKQQNDSDKAQAQDIFANLAHAYEILSDDERRRQYDLQKKYGTPGDGKTYYEATPSNNNNSPGGPTTFSSTSVPTSSSSSSVPSQKTTRRVYTSQPRTTTKSTTFASRPGSFGSSFHDPMDVFKQFFGDDFDINMLNDPVVDATVSSHPSGKQVVGMSSSTSTKLHGDRTELITTTTMTFSDGSVETKSESKWQDNESSSSSAKYLSPMTKTKNKASLPTMASLWQSPTSRSPRTVSSSNTPTRVARKITMPLTKQGKTTMSSPVTTTQRMTTTTSSPVTKQRMTTVSSPVTVRRSVPPMTTTTTTTTTTSSNGGPQTTTTTSYSSSTTTTPTPTRRVVSRNIVTQ